MTGPGGLFADLAAIRHPPSTEDFANPERGLYHHTGDWPGPGAGLPVTITVTNDGLAAPRTWLPGTTTTIDQTVTLPADLSPGEHSLLLALPDPGLSSRPEYPIRLANENVWEPETGFNDLMHIVTIS